MDPDEKSSCAQFAKVVYYSHAKSSSVSFVTKTNECSFFCRVSILQNISIVYVIFFILQYKIINIYKLQN